MLDILKKIVRRGDRVGDVAALAKETVALPMPTPNNGEMPKPPEEVKVIVQPTPNPSAFKFITNRETLKTGKISYTSANECGENELARAIFALPDVSQVHFFENVITVTFTPGANLITADADVVALIKKLMPTHNADIKQGEDAQKRREALSPDLQKIDEILDQTIRPGLQGDGGDIEVLELKDNQLYVRYQGACGSCPSSTQGTLMALEGILKEQFDPDIQVIPV